MPHYYIDDDFCKAWDMDNNLYLYVINYLWEPIDNNKDWIIAVFFLVYHNQKTCKKIHW